MSVTPAVGTKNHLVGSIICTIGNFLLLAPSVGITTIGLFTGIAAIVFGVLVNNRLQSGDTVDAAAKSRLARIFYLITLAFVIIGVIITIIWILVFGGLAIFGSAQ